MNGASKILTVSYGTFSCTLEGFDDPFNTMKAIAEYFRDLAAEDRYFGAEPPTPDAAMLHRIAEREIQRRVEAKIQENGVVLRASDADGEPAVAAPVAAPAVMPAVAPVVAPVAEAPEVVRPAAEVPAPSVVAAPAVGESVVEKLSRLRSEVAAQPAAAAVQTTPVVSFALPDYAEDLETEALDAGVASALADFLPEDIAPDAAELPEERGIEAALLEEAEVEAVDEGVFDAPTEEPAVPDFDLSAVMEAAQADAPAVEDVAEAGAGIAAEPEVVLPEEVAEQAATDDVSDAVMAALAAPEAAVDSPAEEAEEDSAPIAGGEIVADIWPEQEEGVAADAGMLAALDSVLGGATEGEANGEPVAEAVVTEAEAEAVLPQEVEIAAETPVDEAAEPEEAVEEDVQAEPVADLPAPTPVAAPRPTAAEKLMKARARVVRIRRGEDLSGAIEAKAAEVAPAEPAPVVEAKVAPAEPAAEPVVAPVVAEPVAASAPQDRSEIDAVQAKVAESMAEGRTPLLSAEDEAALQRELAALMQNEEEDHPFAETAASAQAEPRRGFEGPSADEALGRLMKQTDSEMSGSETKRRQSAIAHLKAAVAATVADRKVAGEKTGETETVSRLARYRNDLAMAVKAALPGRGGAQAAASGERPAPLVLVSEQRIDRPRSTAMTAAPTAPSAPIRPRRVSSGGLGMATAAEMGSQVDDEEDEEEDVSNLFGDARGFAEFVERVGAVGLEEVLEASAAYLAGVEGRPHFSRPQLMRNLTTVVPAESFQREDGLRSFGTLLREGRIAKVRRGQFTVSEESRYLAEARKIAG
ncbi:hypothetical protein [Tabrizicola sp. M-4]|uniref:hypothetical protein n=1 Tax=Tabrizicola sp. M-4 TaxID=3055847 RepID=UPI003DA846C0